MSFFFIDNDQPNGEKLVIMGNVEYCGLSVFDCWGREWKEEALVAHL